MQRYFLDKTNQIDKDDIHHILNVMRFKTGDIVELCGKNKCNFASLFINNKVVTFTLGEQIKENPPLNVTIIQGLPKGDKMDIITKYATLFQAKSIIFMPMTRSIAKLSNVEHKLSRLNKIAKEAAELSKRTTLPHIEFIHSMGDIHLKDKYLILLDEQEKNFALKDLEINEINQEIIVVIGPEGGIDAHERQMYLGLGARPLSLGESILPTELAHIPILNACLLNKI